MPRLREQIADLMRADGTPCQSEDVLILQGSQQGLDFATKMLVDPEDVIITEDPTFLGALIAFNPCQPKYSAVPLDQDGMQMPALEHVLKTQPCAKMITQCQIFRTPPE